MGWRSYPNGKFTQQGNFGNIVKDGEYFAGKGIGKVTVAPNGTNMEIDVFVTHTISEEDNYQIREHQADELIDQIEKSKADFVILGGDFNASPLMDNVDKTYHKVKKHMTDAFQEIMANINAWLNEEFATYANPRNTYTGGKDNLKLVIYDYIFHKKNVSKKSFTTFLFNANDMFSDSRYWNDLGQMVLPSIPESSQFL